MLQESKESSVSGWVDAADWNRPAPVSSRGSRVVDGRFHPMVGASERMNALYRQIEQAGPSGASVLIVGETGTGKELVAQTLHRLSARRSKPFVAVNCAAIPENLVEGELFGHEKGAFTGAIARAAGYFEQANGGTLFLDEISAMPVSQQAKLLRILQEGTLRRVGGTTEIGVDVRVIAAMNVEPERALADGRLRADVYYRLSVFVLRVAPLRDRREDVLRLARHFASEYATQKTPSPIRFDHGAAKALTEYAWPGNVRELRNAVERAVILSKNGIIRLEDLPAAVARDTEAPLPHQTVEADLAPSSEAPDSTAADLIVGAPGMTLEELKRRLILTTLEASGNNITEAARMLGISARTIYNKIRKWNLSPGELARRSSS
jgi:DNA-binding NtrC family response regulator